MQEPASRLGHVTSSCNYRREVGSKLIYSDPTLWDSELPVLEADAGREFLLGVGGKETPGASRSCRAGGTCSDLSDHRAGAAGAWASMPSGASRDGIDGAYHDNEAKEPAAGPDLQAGGRARLRTWRSSSLRSSLALMKLFIITILAGSSE